MNRMWRMFLILGCCVWGLGFNGAVYAAPDLGVSFPAFKLQALDSQFYGTEGAEGKISILYFLGHDCAPCVGAGPYLESELWQVVRAKPNVQMLGLDLWNGSIAELSLYKNITGITFPLLRQAGLSRNYAGAGLSDMVVVDQEGYVRLVVNGEDRGAYSVVMNMIASLENKTPLVRMITKTLYYGRTMNVGQTKSQEVTLTNTGAGALEITGMKTSVPNLTMEPPSFTLAPYSTQTVTVTFAPTDTGVFSENVTLEHGDRGVDPLLVELIEVTVEGQVFPSLVLAQDRFELGEVDLDKTVEKVVTISNAGPGVLHVSDIATDDMGVVIPDRAFDVAPNESRDIVIKFQPQVEADVVVTLVVVSDDPGPETPTIVLTATGIFVPADRRTDFDGSGKVEFADFVAFAQHFGSDDVLYDLDESGRVDFADFLTFASSFGKSVE